MKTNESLGRDLLRLLVWYPLRWLITILPVPTALAVLRRMGDCHYLLAKRSGFMALRANIDRIVPGAENPERIIRTYFQNHYIDRLLILVFPKLTGPEIDRLVSFKGLEHLTAACAAGKGALLVHGHFGPVHLPLVTLARLGYPMKQIGMPSDEGLSWVGRLVAFRLRMKYEAKIPAEIVKADSFLRGIFTWLGNKGIVMITGDGTGTQTRLGKHHVFRLVGQPVLFPLGPAILAQKTGAALLPLFIVPNGQDGRYTIVIEAPLTSPHEGAEAIADKTSQFVRRLESYICRNPGFMHFLDKFQPGELIVDTSTTIPVDPSQGQR